MAIFRFEELLQKHNATEDQVTSFGSPTSIQNSMNELESKRMGFYEGLVNDLDTRVDRFGAIQNRPNTPLLEKGVQTFGQGAGFAANTIERTAEQIPGVRQAFEAFGTGINWLATQRNLPTGLNIADAGDVIGNSKWFTDVVNLYDTDPNFKDTVDGIANFARLTGDVEMAVDGVNLIKKASKKLVDKTSQLAGKAKAMLPDDITPNGLLIRARNMAEPVKTPEQALGQISQGKVGDITPVRNALESIDTSGVNTFQDLQTRIKSNIPEFARQVDAELAKDTGIYKPNDLAVRGQTAGGKVVSTDHITKALTDLKELYTKIGDKVSAGNISETLAKAKKIGLTRKEVNDISRTYGQEFSEKAFSKVTGEPLTSVNAQAFENTRAGLKTTARQGLGGAEAKAIDAKLSDLYDTQKLIDRNVEAVNKLKQRINERGLIEKAGYLLAKYGDLLTGGSIRGFVGGLLPRGAGYKVMNALDVESALRKNLDIVERAFKAKTDGEMLKILQSSDSPKNPPSTASETAPRSVKATITTNKTTNSIIPSSMAQPKPNVKTTQKTPQDVVTTKTTPKNPTKPPPKPTPAKKGEGGILETIKNKGKDILDNPRMGLATEDVSSGSSKLGQRIVKEGEQKPTIKLKRDVQITTLSGEKTMIPEDEVLKAYESGGKAVLKDGREYVVSKSQYENIKNNSLKNEAKEFAPELKGTEETVKGGKVYSVGDIQKYADKNNITFKEASKKFPAGDISTKFSSYQLPGGKNYKEIIIKAPESVGNKEYQAYRLELAKKYDINPEQMIEPHAKVKGFTAQEIAKLDKLRGETSPTGFKSSHFPDEPNPISHLRLNERTYKGKNVTFLEELQSDWASAVRKDEGVAKRMGKPMVTANPTHPLLKNWQELSIKRGLQEAIANKSDYFAWINGEQTSARYNLATQVKEVKWNSNMDSSMKGGKMISLKPKEGAEIRVMIDKKGMVVGSDQTMFKNKKLDEVLGKGLADKIMSKETGTLSGEGLSFGGEWADNLYNKQTKNIVEDLTGGKVEVIDMGLPIKDGGIKWGVWREKEGLTGADLSGKNMKVGLEIRQSKNGTNYIITDILGSGKFKAVQKANVAPKTAWATGVKLKKIAGDYYDPRNAETFDISTPKSSGQMAIKLTPEIKAIIRGEAPPMKKTSGKSPIK